MNAHVGDLVKRGRNTRGLAPLLGAVSAAGLAACASNPLATAPVDPASPIAAEITAVAKAERPYPSFNDIPAMPKDQRPARAWAAAADETRGAQTELARQTAPETWTLSNTEGFAQQARADVRDEPASARSGGDTETFAREQRERATPPPPPR